MNRYLLIVFLLCCGWASARAGVVTGNIRDAGLVPQSTNIYFYPKSTPMADSPSVIISQTQSAASDTNGNFSITLAQGNYKVTIGSNALDSFLIAVPEGSTTNNWTSITVGTLTYKYPFSPVYLDRSIVSARGDIWGYDGTNVTRVPIGQWGQVMMANSNIAHGIGWTNISDVLTLGTAAYSNATVFQRHSANLDAWANYYYTSFQLFNTNLDSIAGYSTNKWYSPNGGKVAGDFDVSGMLNTNISATELGYLDGVTNSIQSQLNTKIPSTGIVGDVYSGDPNNFVGLKVHNINNGGNSAIYLTNATRKMLISLMNQYDANTLVINDGTSNRIVVDYNGRLGIGTYTPTALLHVNGTAITEGLTTVKGTLTLGGYDAANPAWTVTGVSNLTVAKYGSGNLQSFNIYADKVTLSGYTPINTNLQILVPGPGTNTLYITNGLIMRISNP